MKMSNLLKISTLCCAVLCGVSNNTCNAVKVVNHEHDSLNIVDCKITRQIFGQLDNVAKRNIRDQKLLPAFSNNIIISNDKEAVLLLPKQKKIVHYSIIEDNKPTTELLHTVQNALSQSTNIKSVLGLKGRLPSNYKISRFYRHYYNLKKNIASYKIKTFNIEVNINNRLRNSIKDYQSCFCNISNIFNGDYDFCTNSDGSIPLQVLFPKDREIAIQYNNRTIFYKNGNISAYKAPTNKEEDIDAYEDELINNEDTDAYKEELINNFVRLNFALSERKNLKNINIESEIKDIFGENCMVIL